MERCSIDTIEMLLMMANNKPDGTNLANCMKDYLEYRKAEEQGLLLRLPCKVGDTVYDLDYYYECDCNYECEEMEQWKCEENIRCEHEYKEYRVKETNFRIPMLAILGKTVFLTKAEAEKALEAMERKT